MLTWLAGLQGKGAMPVQQLLGLSADISSVQNVFNINGKWVAGLGGNYYNNDDTANPEPFGDQANSVLIQWWTQAAWPGSPPSTGPIRQAAVLLLDT